MQAEGAVLSYHFDHFAFFSRLRLRLVFSVFTEMS